MVKKNKSEEKKKKAAVYCRVSTYEQGQGEVSSLNGQEDLLRNYCKAKDWEVNGIYIDKASGSSLERNEIIRLLSCLLYTSPSPRDRTRSRMPSSA